MDKEIMRHQTLTTTKLMQWRITLAEWRDDGQPAAIGKLNKNGYSEKWKVSGSFWHAKYPSQQLQVFFSKPYT